MDDVTIRQVSLEERDLMFQIFTLRVTCRHEMGIITREKYPFGWMDEMDCYSKHFAAIHEGDVIAAGRLTLFDNILSHPYYPVIENIVPLHLKNKALAHFSKDQVFSSFRGNGLRKELFEIRETVCRENNVENLVIDLDISGAQHENFAKAGYTELGKFTIDKINWGISAGILMHKVLL